MPKFTGRSSGDTVLPGCERKKTRVTQHGADTRLALCNPTHTSTTATSIAARRVAVSTSRGAMCSLSPTASPEPEPQRPSARPRAGRPHTSVAVDNPEAEADSGPEFHPFPQSKVMQMSVCRSTPHALTWRKPDNYPENVS